MNSEFQRLPLETQEAVKKTMDTMEPAQTPEEIRETLEGTQKGGVKVADHRMYEDKQKQGSSRRQSFALE